VPNTPKTQKPCSGNLHNISLQSKHNEFQSLDLGYDGHALWFIKRPDQPSTKFVQALRRRQLFGQLHQRIPELV
jgi:hypothetical protein